MKVIFATALSLVLWFILVCIGYSLIGCNNDENVCVTMGCKKDKESSPAIKYVPVQGSKGDKGQGCYTVETLEKVEIICGEQTTTIHKPKDGKTGATGTAGESGSAGSNGIDGLAGETGVQGQTGAEGVMGPSGPPGTQGDQGMAGEPGETGEAGPQGLPGQDGTSCQVSQEINGAVITCGNTTAVILNGIDGDDAHPTAYSVTELIDPCGDSPGQDEVLLKLANGQYIAWYISLGLSVIGPGNWQTTDASHCNFNISNEGVISW